MLPLGHMGITVAVVQIVESNFESPWVDYRLMLVASLLPDLIDKPMRYLFGKYPIFNGSNYGHSLLFILILFIAAVAQWYYRNNFTALILCIGSLMHDVIDAVSHHDDWADRALFNTNMLLIGEIIGGCILIYFFSGLVLHNKIEDFIKNGEL